MVGLAVVAATALMLTRHHAGGTSSATDAAPPAPGPAVAAASAAARIVIDVGGHVRHPGLVTLQLGARVADAIAAAGGALDPSDVATLDLAARVSDGQLLLIGVPGAPSLGGTGSAAPVSLNSATVEQLDALPGVGPVLAQRIISWRDAHGGFRTLDELQQVPGIGARKYADLKALVSV
jgi:competence protein ComEA